MHDVSVASEPPPPTGGIRTIRVPLRDFLVPSVPLLMEIGLAARYINSHGHPSLRTHAQYELVLARQSYQDAFRTCRSPVLGGVQQGHYLAKWTGQGDRLSGYQN